MKMRTNVSKQRQIAAIHTVNFAISNRCTANCFYCPKDRGLMRENKLMSLDTFERVLNNIKGHGEGYGIQVIRLGENGDLFLNPKAIEMFRVIRREFPGTRIELFNHFFLVDRKIADVLLDERLVDAVYMNIDGIRNYRLVKRLDFERISGHLEYFIAKRDSLGLSLPVHVRALTLGFYISAVRNNLKRDPVAMPLGAEDATDDYEDIKAYAQRILNPTTDSFKRTYACLWAERPSFKHERLDLAGYHCPQLFKLETEAYVNPDGCWYLCCLDSRQELIVGDLTKEPLCTLAQGEKRREYLSFLKAGQFERMGGPCRTVPCCHIYHPSRMISALFRVATKYAGLLGRVYSYWRKAG